MNTKRLFALLVLSPCLAGFGQSPPPIPNSFFPFQSTNGWQTVWLENPLGYSTNLISTVVNADASLLILDTTNLAPAFLNYNVRETNFFGVHQNINYGQATLVMDYVPNWQSSSIGGTGPGQNAILIAGGDWSSGSPLGLLEIFVDPTGNSLNFSEIQSGVSNLIVSTPIAWTSNVFVGLAFEWDYEWDAEIYTNQALAATSDTGTTLAPARSAWTNGFWIGSDNTGYKQMRGGMYGLTSWGQELGGFETNYWQYDSNMLANWQATLGGGGFGGMMGMLGGGSLLGDGGGSGTVGGGVMFTNMTAKPDTNSDGGMTYTFSITGGGPPTNYDVFSTTNVWTNNNITNATWTWLGSGTNEGTYTVTNQPATQEFFIMGGNLDPDNSGFTTAYENLIIRNSPFNTNASAPAVPLGWIFSLGLIPNYNYLANSGVRLNYTYDAVGRLDLVTGQRSETISNDLEGNILSAH